MLREKCSEYARKLRVLADWLDYENSDGGLSIDIKIIKDLREMVDELDYQSRQYATIGWNVEDIQEIRDGWSQDRCENTLAEHENSIEEIMCRNVWEYLEDYLDD